MLFARILRSPHPHARIKSIDVSKAQALPGVKAILTHENCRVVWGAGSIAGGQQYNDEVKKITTQRRYAFNNPVRFVGEPVAAVAAVDRHVAEEALALIAVDYEVLPFVLDMNEALTAAAPKIWPEGNLSPNNRNEVQPISARRGDVAAALDDVRPACSRIATRPPSCTTRRWSRGPAWRTGTATSSPSTRRPAASPTAATTWRATSASPKTRSASSSSTWAATSATRTRTRTPT